ncbi:MAG TPA: tRNA-dihydrouridine synthase [Candidatus Saccharimonadales bacterium]|nr:tRNA-dihydrouridine synthase [Candidatus Saccharimonadales bacterium]
MSFLDGLTKPFLVLAPMDDVTDTVFRQVIAGLAPPDLYFTEFVNVDGLQSRGREKLLPKLRFSEKERPIIAQIWGIKPENFYKTTKEIIEMGFDGVDLNFGCPIKKIVKGGACAALINNRELASEIIDATREACLPAGRRQGAFPVCVKTRVGFTTVDLSWLEFLLSKKLDLLSIHGRTAKQLSNIPADWSLIGEVRKMRDVLCPATLIVGNGDVSNRGQAEELAKKYKLDGVMVGRGIFHDPFLFAKTSPWGNYTKEQKIELFRRHIELFAKTWPRGEYRFDSLKKFCKVYINGFDGASDLRANFMTAKNPKEALNIISE